MMPKPSSRIDDVLHSNQSSLVADRFIDQRFRMFGNDVSVPYQSQVYVVNAHRTVVGAGYTSEKRRIVRTSIVDVEVRLSDGANDLHEFGRRIVIVAILPEDDCRAGKNQPADQY